MTLVEALRDGDAAEFERLLAQADDVDAPDEHGWTALHWAAGQGRLAFVERLLERGADVFKRGRDQRTPYLVALAAGRRDVVEALRAAEQRRGGDVERASSRQGELRPYCRAYPLARLRAFPGWPPSTEDAPADDAVVFLHHDLTVTRSALHGQGLLLASESPEWRAFCAQTLGFRVPDDLDLLADA